MSVSIQEARNMRWNIDVEGTVQKMTHPQFVKKESGELVKVCNAELIDKNGETIKISFWNDEIKKVKNGVRIAIFNAYTRIFRGVPFLNKSRKGWIEVLDFNPDVTFYDIAKFLKYEKHVKTFEEYCEYIQSLQTNVYLGTKKENYLEILDALIIIKLAREQGTKQNAAEQRSIYFLHQKIGLSPQMIIQILRLFGIEMTTERILRLSTNWKDRVSLPDFPKLNYHVKQRKTKNPEGDLEDQYSFEITCDEYPEEITIDEDLEIQNNEEPLCRRSTIEFDRKYANYEKFYGNPW